MQKKNKEISLWNITFWLKVNLLKIYFHLKQKQIVDWIAIKILLFLLNNKLNYAKPYKSQVVRAKNATNIAIQQRTKIKALHKKAGKKRRSLDDIERKKTPLWILTW